MNKNNQGPKAPTVSSIPIPASDNPMVIDLPDGQKIVLGKLSPGAVIEVATWRGTGRPDSRTNRLMLGVSDTADIAPTPSPTPDSSAKIQVERSNLMSGFFAPIVSVFSKALKRTSDLAPVESTTDLEINAWIENLSREVNAEPKPAPRKAVAKKTTVKKSSSKKLTSSTKKTSK